MILVSFSSVEDALYVEDANDVQKYDILARKVLKIRCSAFGGLLILS